MTESPVDLKSDNATSPLDERPSRYGDIDPIATWSPYLTEVNICRTKPGYIGEPHWLLDLY